MYIYIYANKCVLPDAVAAGAGAGAAGAESVPPRGCSATAGVSHSLHLLRRQYLYVCTSKARIFFFVLPQATAAVSHSLQLLECQYSYFSTSKARIFVPILLSHSLSLLRCQYSYLVLANSKASIFVPIPPEPDHKSCCVKQCCEEA